jgi:ketosteroid isomerase-like protein
VVVSFIDAINHGDIDRLANLMTDDHELVVFSEPAHRGREAMVEAWHGYATSFPDYVIYPDRIAERAGRVAVLGHTTGSHLGFSDEEEAKLTLIWVARVRGGRVQTWHLLEDTPARRAELGLDES